MRLWHYELIEYLPDAQLIKQWEDLNKIFLRTPKNYLIDYIYEYPERDLYSYSYMVIKEMRKRNFSLLSINNFLKYFSIILNKDNNIKYVSEPFKNHHTKRYLVQCFYRLQEIYDRTQDIFSSNDYRKIELFIKEKINDDK